MVGRDAELIEKRFGMDGHLDLAGHRLADLATIADQHRQRNSVILDQRGKRIDCHADRGVLHDDGRPSAAHEGASTQPHPLILAVRRDMDHLVGLLDLFDHPGKLLAGHSGHETDIVLDHRVHDDIIH